MISQDVSTTHNIFNLKDLRLKGKSGIEDIFTTVKRAFSFRSKEEGEDKYVISNYFLFPYDAEYYLAFEGGHDSFGDWEDSNLLLVFGKIAKLSTGEKFATGHPRN